MTYLLIALGVAVALNAGVLTAHWLGWEIEDDPTISIAVVLFAIPVLLYFALVLPALAYVRYTERK